MNTRTGAVAFFAGVLLLCCAPPPCDAAGEAGRAATTARPDPAAPAAHYDFAQAQVALKVTTAATAPTNATFPVTTTTTAATTTTGTTRVPVTTTTTAATTPFPTGTMHVAWNAKGKVVDAPTTAADNVVGATNVVVWMPTCMTFTDVKTQLAACSTSGAECMITIGGNITWSEELTVQGSQRVTMKGVVAGGGRAVLDAKASQSDPRRHLTVAKGGTLSLFNLELKNGYKGNNGGAINNAGTINSIAQCTFNSNIAVRLQSY